MLRSLAIALSLILPTSVFAQTPANTLFSQMGLDRMIPVMRQEGLQYGAEIGEGMFGDIPRPAWAEVVSDIYDEDRLREGVEAAFVQALDETDVTPLIAFFQSERGQRIVDLEISARRAMLDADVEAASKDVAQEQIAANSKMYQVIDDFVQVNDLVEANVVGALNASYAFYMGLMGGGAFGNDLTEDQVLRDVWSQEGDIRASTTEWVYSFLLMAYDPLEATDIDAYILLSKTEEGKAMNRALFEAFDQMFVGVSGALGMAAAEMMQTEEL